MIFIAHIAGFPVEELLTASTSGIAAGMLLSLSAIAGGLCHKWNRQPRP